MSFSQAFRLLPQIKARPKPKTRSQQLPPTTTDPTTTNPTTTDPTTTNPTTTDPTTTNPTTTNPTTTDPTTTDPTTTDPTTIARSKTIDPTTTNPTTTNPTTIARSKTIDPTNNIDYATIMAPAEIKEINDFLKNMNITYRIIISDVDSIEKIFKIRCLYHKLLFDTILNKKKNNDPIQFDTILNKNKDSIQFDKLINSKLVDVKIPLYNFIKCLTDKVTTKLTEKINVSKKQTKYESLLDYRNFYTVMQIYGRYFFKHFFNNTNFTILDYIIEIDNTNLIKIKDDQNNELNINKLFTDITIETKRFILIYLRVSMHANSIIIDKQEFKIYHFEPNSYNFLLDMSTHILLKNWLYNNDESLFLTNKIIKSFITNTPFNNNDINEIIEYYFTQDPANPLILHYKCSPDCNNEIMYDTDFTYNQQKIQVRTPQKYIDFITWIRDNISNQSIDNLTLNQDSKKNLSFTYDTLLFHFFHTNASMYKYYSAYSITRIDLPIISTKLNIDFDATGYCIIQNYFFWFLLLFNDSNNFDLSLIMCKWVYNYNKIFKNVQLSTDFVRQFGTIIFQYYNKCVFEYISILTTKKSSIEFEIKPKQLEQITILHRNVKGELNITNSYDIQLKQIKKALTKNQLESQLTNQLEKKKNLINKIKENKSELIEENKSELIKKTINELKIQIDNYKEKKDSLDTLYEKIRTPFKQLQAEFSEYVNPYNEKMDKIKEDLKEINTQLTAIQKTGNKEKQTELNKNKTEQLKTYEELNTTLAKKEMRRRKKILSEYMTTHTDQLIKYINDNKKENEASIIYENKTIDQETFVELLNKFVNIINGLNNYRNYLIKLQDSRNLEVIDRHIIKLTDYINKITNDIDIPFDISDDNTKNTYKEQETVILNQKKEVDDKIEYEYDLTFNKIKYTFKNEGIMVTLSYENKDKKPKIISLIDNTNISNIYYIFLYTEIIRNQDFINYQADNCYKIGEEKGKQFTKNYKICSTDPDNFIKNKYLKYKLKYLNLKNIK